MHMIDCYKFVLWTVPLNVAKNKRTTLSRVYSNDHVGSYAVDGITGGPNYSASGREINPWWRVELDTIYLVTEIISNRILNSLI